MSIRVQTHFTKHKTKSIDEGTIKHQDRVGLPPYGICVGGRLYRLQYESMSVIAQAGERTKYACSSITSPLNTWACGLTSMGHFYWCPAKCTLIHYAIYCILDYS
jgi:hypothetical protein